MSRQNKVNPGQYTQRGRLAQDDMARELKVQDASISSQKSWQPASERQTPWPEATSGDAAEAEDSPVSETTEAREKPRKRAAKAKPGSRAKATSEAKTSSKAKTPRVARKAVLARSAGKGSALLKAGRTKKKTGTTKRKR